MKEEEMSWLSFAKHASPKTTKDWYYFAIGACWLVVAGIGVAVPILPSVPFIIIAAPYFAKSSPLIYAFLKESKDFGPAIIHLESNASMWCIPIPKKAKKRAVIMIIASYCLSLFAYFFFSFANPYVLIAVACMLVMVSIFILTRPSEYSYST